MDVGCNEPRCPLNRRGVPHRPHDAIERDDVVDQCNDPQCALTRLGMPHNSHGPMDGPAVGPRDRGGTGGGRSRGGPGRGGADPAGGAGRTAGGGRSGGRGGRGGGAGRSWAAAGSTTSSDEILDEAARHLQERRAWTGSAAPPTHARPSHTREEADRILRATDPHDILGVPSGAAISHVRSRYRKLVKRHDAARGILYKTAPERERSSLIMAKINGAFEAIKAARSAPG